MIDRELNKFVLFCDICGEIRTFDDFSNVLDYKQSHGWKSVKELGEWLDICPECVEGSGV